MAARFPCSARRAPGPAAHPACLPVPVCGHLVFTPCLHSGLPRSASSPAMHLLHHFNSQRLAAACRFPQPAPPDHPWRTMPRHAMTPHYSGTTLDAQARGLCACRGKQPRPAPQPSLAPNQFCSLFCVIRGAHTCSTRAFALQPSQLSLQITVELRNGCRPRCSPP